MKEIHSIWEAIYFLQKENFNSVKCVNIVNTGYHKVLKEKIVHSYSEAINFYKQ